MINYMNSKDRTERLVQKVLPRKKGRRKLAGLVLAGAMIAGTGLTCYTIISHPIKYSKEISLPNENIPERRVRLLSLAEEQLKDARTPQEANGLRNYIQDIENGVYDYSR